MAKEVQNKKIKQNQNITPAKARVLENLSDFCVCGVAIVIMSLSFWTFPKFDALTNPTNNYMNRLIYFPEFSDFI